MKSDLPATVSREERSLVELPFTPINSSRDRRSSLSQTWEGEDKTGKVRLFKTVRWSEEIGMPSFFAEDLYIALLWAAGHNGFTSRRFQTCQSELLAVMQKTKSGRNAQLLKQALQQLTSLTIHTNALYNPDSRIYAEGEFHILESWKLSINERSGSKQYDITWNEEFFGLLHERRLKNLDIETYYGFNHNTTKRLFRWLDKHFQRNWYVRIGLLRLAHQKLEISPMRIYPSKLVESLKPAFAELEKHGIAEHILEESASRKDPNVVFFDLRTPTGEVWAYEELVKRLVASHLGFDHERAAGGFIKKHGRRLVYLQLRHLYYVIAHGQSIPSPAGWLNTACRKHYKLPDELLVQLKKESEAMRSQLGLFTKQESTKREKKPAVSNGKPAEDATRESHSPAQERKEKYEDVKVYIASLTGAERGEVLTMARGRLIASLDEHLRGAASELSPEEAYRVMPSGMLRVLEEILQQL